MNALRRLYEGSTNPLRSLYEDSLNADGKRLSVECKMYNVKCKMGTGCDLRAKVKSKKKKVKWN